MKLKPSAYCSGCKHSSYQHNDHGEYCSVSSCICRHLRAYVLIAAPPQDETSITTNQRLRIAVMASPVFLTLAIIVTWIVAIWIGPEYGGALAGTAACFIPIVFGLIWAAWYAHGPDIDPNNWTF